MMSLAVWKDNRWWIDIRTMILERDDAPVGTFRLLSHYGGKEGIAFSGGTVFFHLRSIPISIDSLARWAVLRVRPSIGTKESFGPPAADHASSGDPSVTVCLGTACILSRTRVRI